VDEGLAVNLGGAHLPSMSSRSVREKAVLRLVFSQASVSARSASSWPRKLASAFPSTRMKGGSG
jgi:hypothetical protein